VPVKPGSARTSDTLDHVDGRTGSDSRLVVVVADLRPTLWRALRLLIETVVIPMVLLLTLIHVVGLLSALVATLGWLALTLVVRFVSRRRLPGTLFLCVSMMSGRALVALATSSAFIYMIQPVLGSVCMAAVFMGSAVAGRPVTMRLAKDFIAIPAHILNRRGVRRMFTEIALIWGLSRLVDAAMNFGFLRLGLDAGLLSRGILSPILTIATICISVAWGVRALRLDGIRIQLGAVAPV
jgi:hypothetical protein